VEQLAAYCETARAAGVGELAVTEHLFRFRQAEELLGGFWSSERVPASLQDSMAKYWEFHATADLDDYVRCAQEAKDAGLPVVIGLEVDYYPGRMDEVAGLLRPYPFDVLLGSVHWLGAWRFDDIDVPLQMDQWSAREVDGCWEDYTTALEELAASGACDVLAHPDLIKVAGYVPAAPEEWWDRMAEAAAASGMAAELSSAGWRKPVGEQYPALPLLQRFAARGVPFTTASDAHRREHVADRAGALRELLGSVGVTTLQAYEGRLPHTVAVGSPLPAGGEGS
jgi:histidinol-phosphatase (PHP family)